MHGCSCHADNPIPCMRNRIFHTFASVQMIVPSILTLCIGWSIISDRVESSYYGISPYCHMHSLHASSNGHGYATLDILKLRSWTELVLVSMGWHNRRMNGNHARANRFSKVESTLTSHIHIKLSINYRMINQRQKFQISSMVKIFSDWWKN